MAEVQVNGFHNQPEGVAFPLPVEENGIGYPMPIEGEGKPFPLPVEGEGKPFPLPVEEEGKPFPLPVEEEGKPFPLPVEGEGKPFPLPVEEEGRTFPIEIPKAKQGKVKVTPYMTESLDKVAKAEGFNNYDVKIDHGSSIGDGFVGILFRATLREIDSDKQLTVVIKSPPDGKARREDFGAMSLFEREVKMYSEVLPAFVKFQEERKISKSLGFFAFPKCYFAEYDKERDEAIIIMEDLKDQEYKMWNKAVPANYEHAKLLVTTLGKFHAISFAMKEQQPEMFGRFKEMEDILIKKFTDSNMTNMMSRNIEKAANLLDPTDTKRRNRVLRLDENYAQTMKDLMSSELSEPFAVVGHGDCWINNFMYQYRRGRAEKIIFIDWQCSRYVSPAIDFVHFVFSCTDGPLRAKHYDEFLNLYHRSLKDTLDHLGGDTMTQFPFTAFLRQLKQFGKFGVVMAMIMIPMMSISSDMLPDMDFMAENMNKNDPALMEEMMKSFMGGSGAADARTRDVLLDAIRYGYL